MGTIKKGILGGFSGKVGTVVGASWKGIDYIRSLPASVRNPRTPGQVNQRNKFATVIKFLSKINPVIKVGFKDYTAKQTATNAAMSYNMLNAVKDEVGNIELDYPNVMVSRGELYRPKSGEVTLAESEITVSWDSEFAGNGALTDMSMILLYNSTKNEAIFENNASDRAEGVIVLTFPENWNGDTVHSYVSFVSKDGKLVSDSLYLGQVAIPEI